MIIHSRAPLRLSLAGGGTDIKSFSDTYGGAVINFTINKFAYSTIRKSSGNKVIFKSHDLDQEVEYNLNTVDKLSNIQILKLHYYTYMKMMKNFNNGEFIPLLLETICENPPGSGLGTSSAIVVSMIKAFDEFLNLQLGKSDIAKMAYEIERIDCGFSGGQQDQYAASFGGFNYIEFKKNGEVTVTPLNVNQTFKKKIEHKGFLFFSGVSRESSRIIDDQSRYFENNNNALKAMNNLKGLAFKQRKIIESLDFNQLMSSLNDLWIEKKKTSTKVSNDRIDNIMNIAFKSGAVSGKVSGAGGGGFFLFFVNDKNRIKLKNKLSEFNGYIENFSLSNHGAESWVDE